MMGQEAVDFLAKAFGFNNKENKMSKESVNYSDIKLATLISELQSILESVGEEQEVHVLNASVSYIVSGGEGEEGL